LTYLEPDSLIFLEQEFFTDLLLGERKLLDVVVKARFKNVPLPPGLARETFFLIHIENQATSEARFPERVFRYLIRLFDKHNLPVYPIVIFSFDELRRTIRVFTVLITNGAIQVSTWGSYSACSGS
jgi:hypothetical protein